MHRLALALGGRTVAELEHAMSYRELLDWIAIDSVDPIGEIRSDFRNAMLCQKIVDFNYWLAGEKNPHRDLADFMPFRPDKTGVMEELPKPEKPSKKPGPKVSSEVLTNLFLLAAPGGKIQPSKKRKG